MMRRIMRKAAVLVSAAGLLLAGAVVIAGPAEAAAAATPQNCASGYVCIYKTNGLGTPLKPTYFTYKAYNFTNMTGNYLVYNHQTGGAGVQLYSGYNGTGSILDNVPAGTYHTFNLTPVNSIKLTAKASSTGPIGSCPNNHVCLYSGPNLTGTKVWDLSASGAKGVCRASGLVAVGSWANTTLGRFVVTGNHVLTSRNSGNLTNAKVDCIGAQ